MQAQQRVNGPNPHVDDYQDLSLACQADDLWNELGGEGISPTCRERSHAKPSRRYGAKILLSKERICGADGNLISTVIHEIYHLRRHEVVSALCKKYRTKDNRIPPDGESDRFRNERRLMWLLYITAWTIEEGAASLYQLRWHGPPGTPAPEPGHIEARKASACRQLEITERRLPQICDLIDTLEGEKTGDPATYPSPTAPGFDLETAKEEKDMIKGWYTISVHNKSLVDVLTSEDD